MKNWLSVLKTWSGSIYERLAAVSPQLSPVEYSWMMQARSELGQSELPGAKHNPRIVEYHQLTKLRAKDDETPWCSSFVNWCLSKSNYPTTESAAARSWATYGAPCLPHPGAIVVLTRKGGGHVGFYVKETPAYVYLLGGNQGNAVTIAAYAKDRVIGYRIPKELNTPDSMVYGAKNEKKLTA
jgi:uncharacterized protein (TIGR02594 family)